MGVYDLETEILCYTGNRKSENFRHKNLQSVNNRISHLSKARDGLQH